MTETPSIYPFSRGQFVCKECQSLFFAQREDISYQDGVAFSFCPVCGKEGLETVWMKNLHKTVGSAKGANMSPEGRMKNRLNGFTTGSTALLPWQKNKIPMPPAKPGKYAECDDCADFMICELSVTEKHGTCVPVYCHRKTDVTLKYAASYLAGDPEMLKLVAANNAAQMQLVFNASIKKIFDSGVELIEKIYEKNKAGDIQCDRYKDPIYSEKIYAHPLIKRCTEIAQVMGFTLADWTMTPKSKEAKEQVSGFLAGMAAGSGKSIEAVSEDLRNSVTKFAESLEKAKSLREQDKTLKTFETESGQREKED